MEMVFLHDPARKPSRPTAAPADMLEAIGLLVLSWESFDQLLDDLLFALARATGAPLDDAGNDFRKRKRQVRQLAKEVFVKHPAVTLYVESILDDSASPYSVRNFVVHSRFWLKMQTGEVVEGRIPGSISMVCLKARKGKLPLRAEFTVAELREAVYATGHLAGRLDALCKNPQALALSSPDRSFLEEFLKKDYQSSSIEPI